MIFGFYYRFYRLTKNKYISTALAYGARFVYFMRYLLKKLFLKKETVVLDLAHAMKILEAASPDPMGRPGYDNGETEEDLDLSVIVPVYNNRELTNRCIESLLTQKTTFSYEIILVDDGSSDGIQDDLDSIRGSGPVVVVHQTNGGIAAARNKGIELARAAYLMFVDCDDIVHEDIIETLMSETRKDDYDIVMCAHALVKLRDGKVVSRLPNISPGYNLLGYKNNDTIMNYDGLPWGKVYKRELFENVRFFPGYWYEDNIIHGLIFPQCKKFKYIPQVKYEYMWHEKNFSHVQDGKKQLKALDAYWILKAITERYRQLELPRGAAYYTMILKHVSAYYYTMISSLPDDVIQAMFVAGRELLLANRPSERVKLPYMLRETEKAMIDGDIALWKLCSLNQ